MGHRDHSGHVRLWVRFVQATGLAVIALATTSAPAVSARELFLQRPVATAASVQDGTSVFAGFTSQHWPSFFRISKNSKRLVIASAALDMKCVSGNQFTIWFEFVGVPIAHGKLHARYTMPSTSVAGGATVSGTSSLTARLDRPHSILSGTWRVYLTYVAATGPTDQCDSGLVRFTVSS